MSSLTLKDIPPELLGRLRERAKQQRRSLSAEALTILEGELCRDYRTSEERAATSALWAAIAGESEGLFDWDVDAIYAARTFGRDVDLEGP